MTNISFSFPKIEAGSLYIKEEEFEEFIVTLLRYKDDVGLKYLGFLAEEEIISKWESSQGRDVDEVKGILEKNVIGPLDKLLILCSLLLQYDYINPLDSVISNLYGIYQIGGRRELGFQGSREHLSSSVIWKDVIVRIYVLGALAVFLKRFEVIPSLVIRSWPKEFPGELYDMLWARHALTMLNREERLKSHSLCHLAYECSISNIWLVKKFKGNLDLFQKSLCQFDFIQCVHAFLKSGKIEDAFPSFGSFDNSQTEPIVLDLILRGDSRKSIPHINDNDLASIIESLDISAKNCFLRSHGWIPQAWNDNRIKEYLKKNLR